MKSIIETLIILLSAQSALAATTQNISPCTSAQKSELRESIAHWSAMGYPETALIYNQRYELLGYYLFDGESGMHAEICEQIFAPDLTIANDWYYWSSDLTSSHPSSWQAGETYELSQDEGIASFKILKNPKLGPLVAEFSVIGWNEHLNEVIARREIIFLSQQGP